MSGKSGAFTGANAKRKGYFELADGGTLFLDEISDMPLELQAKLLRVIEDGCVVPVGGAQQKHVDVRILAATNADLQARISQGTFREDLYFRLARFTVPVPPLRERKEDISLLASHFLTMFAAEMGIQKPVLTPGAMSALETYYFPGNVRELKNIIERALIKSGGSQIQPEHLHFINNSPTTPPQNPTSSVKSIERSEDMVIKKTGLLTRNTTNGIRVFYDENRAESLRLYAVDLGFMSSVSSEEESAKAQRSSPNLTHLVEVKAGDTLPLLCYRIYKDSSYYVEVAKINNIVNFRNLKPGSRLEFPPLR